MKKLSAGQASHVVRVLSAMKKFKDETKAAKALKISPAAVRSIVKQYGEKIEVPEKRPDPMSKEERIKAIMDKQLGVREKVVSTQEVLLDRIKYLAPRTQDIAKVGIALGYVSKVLEPEEEDKEKNKAVNFFQQINNMVVSGQIPDKGAELVKSIKKGKP